MDRGERRYRTPLSEKQQAQLNRDLALARRLGAEVITTPGTHVGEALLRVAQQHNVTQFILGKPLRQRWPFRQSSPVDWLVATAARSTST